MEKLKLKLLNIDGDGYHLQASIKINGKSALVIVDTGASRTVFDKSEIRKFLKKEEIEEHDKLSTGLGTSSMQSQVVTLGSFSLGKIKIFNYNSVLLDLTHVNQTYSAIGLKNVVGVLGSDILVKFNAQIDFRTKTLVLRKPATFPVKTKRKSGKRS
jgi:hypothetical protein